MPGKKAIMTIYEESHGGGERDEDGSHGLGGVSGNVKDSWIEKEKIVLSDYKTKVCDCEINRRHLIRFAD